MSTGKSLSCPAILVQNLKHGTRLKGLTPLRFISIRDNMRPLHRLLGLGLGAALLGCNLPSNRFPLITPPTTAPGPTPTPAIPLTPSPSPTPVPIVRVESGDRALFNGDVETAALQYRAALADSGDAAIQAAALWGLARAQIANKQHAEALATLQQLIAHFPDSPYLGPAHFLEGQVLEATQQYDEAAAAYQAYLVARPGVLDSYVQQRRGDALAAAGRYVDALAAYRAAQEAPHLDDGNALQIKIAQAHAQIGDYATALSMYDSLAAATASDYIKAQMDYLAGQAYLVLNQKEQAYERFRHAVEHYPLSYYSYLGLVELVNAAVEVNDLDRGLTDYFAGQYDVALLALDRFIGAHADDGTAHYYRALTLRELKNYPDAVDEFTYFIQNYAAHPKWSEAWQEKADLQWRLLNQYPEAAQTLLDFVQAAPASPQAVDALMSAARILERDGRFDQAAQVWQRVAVEYPSSAQASTAVFLAGIMQYRQADYNAALPLFQQSLILATRPEEQARADLWIGKTQHRLGHPGEAEAAWRQAQGLDAGGYYSERARDLLLGQPPFSPPLAFNLNVDLNAERRAADVWMRLKFNLPENTDLSGPGPLATDPRMMRGRELWNLGLYEEARLEFEDLRHAIRSDAVLTYRLANYLIELGLYRSAILAARQVLTLAGLNDHASSMLAPPYFSHLRYGLYYADLIVPAAQKEGLDPLFLFSVVRQESLFEGFVHSTAGARGLMQIIPSTGAAIAQRLGWPLYFEADHLYRPLVSITLGASYLASNRQRLGGDLYAALAAYNGGPANALEWKQLAGDDPDLFLESVRFEETRQYIRNIYEIYVVYRQLYGLGP